METETVTPQEPQEPTPDEFRRKHVGFPEVIDSTMLSACACHQKFFLEYVLKLSSTGRSPDLHAGGAFAHAIQHVRLAFYRDGLSLEDALVRGTREFIKFWGWYEPPENHVKDFVTTINALYSYFEQYPPATDDVQPFRKENGDPAVEFTFAIPTEVLHPKTGNPIIYGGRADMIGQRRDLLAVVDEKTAKSIGPAWARSWQMRGQFIGYCFAAHKSGFPCNAALIRGIALQKTQYNHMEVLEQYPTWMIERWWREANRKIAMLVNLYKDTEQFIDHYKETGQLNMIRYAHEWWPFNFGDLCAQYGGCEMLGMCTSEDPTLWYADYDTRLWNPLDQDPTAESPEKPVQVITWEDFIA